MPAPGRFIRLAATLLCVVAAPEARAVNDAGASTFEGAAKRYAPRDVDAIPDADIRVPKVSPQAVTTPTLPDPGARDDDTRFAIREFVVVGNTLLAPTRIEELLSRFTGDEMRIGDVQAARDALEAAYQDDGFVTAAVTIPQQTVDTGRVRFDVIEARIGAVTVRNEGVSWFSDRVVVRDVKHLRPGAMLRRKDLDSDRRALNRNPDRAVQPALRAGAEPGVVDVDLIVADRPPLHARLEATDDRSLGQPDHRVKANVRYGNLWGIEHEAGFTWEFAPGKRFDDVQVYTGTYRAPMPWDSGQSLMLYVSNSNTTSLLPFGGNAASIGKRFDMGATYLATLPSIFEGYTHTIAVGVDRKDVDNRILLEGAVLPPSTIVYLPWRLQWQGVRVSDQAVSSISLGTRFHFSGTLEGGRKADFRRNRCADPTNCFVNGTWTIYTASLMHEMRLPAVLTTLAQGRFVPLPETVGKPFTADWTLALNAEGQIGDEPLIPSEQFLGGGIDSVRGYLQSEAGGDQGWRTQIELRTPVARNFLPEIGGVNLREQVRLLAFYDAAQLITLGTRSREQPFVQTLRGEGVGVRASFLDAFSAEFLLASAREETSASAGLRYHFRLSAGF